MEPWDGPASIAFTDGTVIGAVLDRNGLRPSRIPRHEERPRDHGLGSRVLDIPPDDVVVKERLHPGRIFLVDTSKGRIVDDEEIKRELAAQHPLRRVAEGQSHRYRRPAPARRAAGARIGAAAAAGVRLHAGRIPDPDFADGAERRGARGLDGHRHVAGRAFTAAAAAVRLLQAALRAGDEPAARRDSGRARDRHGIDDRAERNLLRPEPESCRQIQIRYPIIHNEHVAKLRHLPPDSPFRSTTLSLLFDPDRKGQGPW